MNRSRPRPTILIVDDEESIRITLAILLRKQGYLVSEAKSGEEALKKLARKDFDIVLTDLRMDKVNGIGVLRATKKHSPNTAVFIVTAFSTVVSAVEAMKIGAFDYLTKPFNEDELLLKMSKAIELKELMNKVAYLSEAVKDKYSLKNIIGDSPEITKVLETVSQVAKTDVTILIEGESGTGKELIARGTHTLSSQIDKPFIAINCASLPETLLESELFGHAKGAFTGAIKNKRGLFEAANQGTIFLDEIGDMSLATQSKLLRVIEERKVRKVGSNISEEITVRIIAATNKNLAGLVAEGRFREDLYYRINVVSVHIPPLRERASDIMLLASFFVDKYRRKFKKNAIEISAEARDCLLQYHWPGNVRELENVIERGIILGKGKRLEVGDLPLNIADQNRCVVYAGKKDASTLKEMEKNYIEIIIKKNRGDRIKTAQELGIGRNTLWRKLKEYEIET